MKCCFRFFLLIFALSVSVVLRADTDAEVNARKDALELAGAFANDGFKIRDGYSCGVLKPHDHALIDQLVFRSDDVVRTARRRPLARELHVELVESRLHRGDRLRLLLDRAPHFGNLLRVDDQLTRDNGERILELAVLGQELFLAFLERRRLFGRFAGSRDERFDAAEHVLSLADLILERPLAPA